MPPIASLLSWGLAERVGRGLLLGAVAFWWGAYVAPQLFSTAFPMLLPPWDAVLGKLNASNEGTLANTVSATTLAIAAVLALAAAAVSRRRATEWITTGGWIVLAVTLAALAFEEIAEFKRSPGSVVELSERLGYPWPVLVSPLVIVFVLAVSVFVRKMSIRAVGTPLIIGIACWILALWHETSDPFLFAGRARALGYVLEETLEFSGTLLIGLSAAVTLRGGAAAVERAFGSRRRGLLIGSIASVAMLGGLAIIFVFRVPVVEALAPYTRVGAFALSLHDQEAVVQELRMPGTPIQSLRLSLGNCNSNDRLVAAAVRVTRLGSPDRGLAEGSVAVPVRDCPRWKDIELLPPVTVAEGQSLGVQIIADTEFGASLSVGATKGDRYPNGRLWINGESAWPDQDIELVAYGAPGPTRSKLLAIRQLLTSDWRWPALMADLAVALTLITFVPVLLAAVALPRPPGKRLLRNKTRI